MTSTFEGTDKLKCLAESLSLRQQCKQKLAYMVVFEYKTSKIELNQNKVATFLFKRFFYLL